MMSTTKEWNSKETHNYEDERTTNRKEKTNKTDNRANKLNEIDNN